MKNEFKLKIVETNENVTIILYSNCMDIINENGFITTIDRDDIINANIEINTNILRIRTGVRDNLLLDGNDKDLEKILDYCISKYREANAIGYYSMLISCYITYISWITVIVIGFLKSYDVITPFDIRCYAMIIAFVSLFITYCLLELFGDSKPKVKYPEK